MPKKIFSLPREAAVSSRFRRARISSGFGRSASLMRRTYASASIPSKVEDHVGDKSELVVTRSIIIRGDVVRMIVSKFRTNSHEFVRPPRDTDGMLRVLRSEARAATNLVFKVFVPNGKEGARRKPKHGVVDNRPLRRVTVPYRKRTALEWHLLGRMIHRVVHVHIPGFGGAVDLVIELVRPGSDILLQIVVAKLAVVEAVCSGVDRIHLVTGSPLDHHRASRLTARIILPDCNVSSGIYTGLNRPLIVNLRGRKDSFMTIVIKAVEDRMARH